MGFRVKFWGVRGSIACPAATHMKYGGNTSCIEVQAGETHVIFDAGTGIRPLGQDFLKRGYKQSHLLLTHTHWDHINGFPFFAPAFIPSNSFHVMAGHLQERGGVRDVIANQMANPMFPVPLAAMQAKLTFEDFRAGDGFALPGGVAVRTCELRHPNKATGYRVDYEGKSFCIITDTEHVPGQLDANILGLIEGADVVAYDSTYTDAEFPAKVGWGHSTWTEGLKLCKAAGAKRLAIFHHDPDHDDAFMEALEAEAAKTWPGCFAARDNLEVTLA